nr:hypothetical protein [Candidatus Sigynarchaeota archaeon]
QGIQVFDQLRAKLKKEDTHFEGKVKKPLIYLAGTILNMVEPVWLIIANLFGESPAIVTSMFGIGLVFLLLYSARVLHEHITRREIFGALVIIAGTLVLGIEAIARPGYDEILMSIPSAFLFIAIFAAIGIMLIILALKTRSARTIGIIFGLVAGGYGGQDILFKMLGQLHIGDMLGWLVFGSSFVVAFLAFFFTQWGFARKAQASTLVPAYDSLYVVIPVVYQALLLPGYEIWLSTIAGIVLVIIGVVLMKGLINSS